MLIGGPTLVAATCRYPRHVGLLGTVFEALFIPDEGMIPTIRATAAERRDEAATEATASALLADVADADVPRIVRAMILPARVWGAFKFRGKSDAPPGPFTESRLDVWFDPPRRARIDRTWTNNGAAEHLVCLAEEFRTQTGAKRERTYDVTRHRWLDRPAGTAPSDNDVVRHFWPPHLREIVTGLSFAEPREASVAGRQVARVHATQRVGGLWPHWLIWGANEFDLAFDLEYGHLLLVEGYRDGHLLGAIEVTSITYGDQLEDETFAVG